MPGRTQFASQHRDVGPTHLQGMTVVMTGEMEFLEKEGVQAQIMACGGDAFVGDGQNYVLVLGNRNLGQKPNLETQGALTLGLPVVTEEALIDVLYRGAPVERLLQPDENQCIAIGMDGRTCLVAKLPSSRTLTKAVEVDEMWKRIVARNPGLMF